MSLSARRHSLTRTVLAAALIAGAATGRASFARAEIKTTKHNLSASGPGTVKASGLTSDLCVFCHTPHNAQPSRALWNPQLPGTTYTLYTSSTLEARLNQPTGSSRLCLSCHDGTLALGTLRVPPETGPVTLGPAAGSASLGADLSDDHPVSFVYDAALAAQHGQLVEPAALPRTLPLDDTQQLQCTTCHDPHDATYRKFLRVDDRNGALCTACHRVKNWAGSSHATSSATWSGSGSAPWPAAGDTTVASHGCDSCHRPHAAPHPARLLSSAQETGVCLACHAGTVAAKNLEPEFLKPSAHPVTASSWAHDPQEDPARMPRHVACVDCHNPHEVEATSASPPLASGRLKGVRGVDLSGAVVAAAQYEYEVCLKCHGIRDQTLPGILRQDNTRNARIEFSPSNPSYHPVAAPGKNASLQGLEPGYTTSSVITCTACHNNDAWGGSAAQPNGPHGSAYAPILEREYRQEDPVVETFQSAALCYKCHNQSALLSTGRFPHRQHLDEGQASCAVCHDAHGSRQHPRLINFMLRDRAGQTVVGPTRQGQIEFLSTTPGRGQCTLVCHGTEHNRQNY